MAAVVDWLTVVIESTVKTQYLHDDLELTATISYS